jgi:WD40 repeat protein
VNAPRGVQVWDTRTRRLLATSDYRDGALSGPVFSPDGSLLAYSTTYPGNRVVLASARTLHTVAVLKAGTQVYSLALSHDGQMLAAGGGNGTVMLWDTRTHQPIEPITAGSSQMLGVAFSPDGQTLAVGSADFLVRIFDVRTRTLIAVLTGHTDAVTDVAFSPDGQNLASASHDGFTQLWNVDPRAAVRRLCQAVQGPSLAKQWAGLRADVGLGPPPCPG